MGLSLIRKLELWRKYNEYTHNSFGNPGSLGTSVHHVPRNHRDEFFNEHHLDPHMPEQFDQEDGLFKFEKRMK